MIHETSYDENLPRQLANLRYDVLADFLQELRLAIAVDSYKDRSNGKVKLAEKLIKASNNLDDAKDHIEEAWEICKPHMKDNGSC